MTMEYTRLSEAIRAGAELRPQAFGDYVAIDDRHQTCTCALGAAYEAVTGIVPDTCDVYDEQPSGNAPSTVLTRTFNLRDVRLVTPLEARIIPDIEKEPIEVYRVVAQLNDRARWSREQIADWLEAQGL
jgi:hypothetical protein